MTKEQEEIIERLNRDANTPLYCGDITIVNIEDIETVLNMLKEKDEEIERLRYIKKSFDYVVQKETEKKDKIIDLIINEFYKRVKISENCYIQKSRGIENCLRHKNCKECLKQYFKEIAERKSEE